MVSVTVSISGRSYQPPAVAVRRNAVKAFRETGRNAVKAFRETGRNAVKAFRETERLCLIDPPRRSYSSPGTHVPHRSATRSTGTS
jgi:hypothetical protein